MEAGFEGPNFRGRASGAQVTRPTPSFKGRVTTFTELRRVFVALGGGPAFEGLVLHGLRDELDQGRTCIPGKIVSTSQEVEVMGADVDPQKRGRNQPRPQADLVNQGGGAGFARTFPAGSERLEGARSRNHRVRTLFCRPARPEIGRGQLVHLPDHRLGPK